MLVPTFIKPDARNRLSKAKVERYGIVSLVKIGPTEFVFLISDSSYQTINRKKKRWGGKILNWKKFPLAAVLAANAIRQKLIYFGENKIASIEHLFQTSQCTLCFLGWRAIANCRTCQLGLFHRQLDTVANTEPLAI